MKGLTGLAAVLVFIAWYESPNSSSILGAYNVGTFCHGNFGQFLLYFVMIGYTIGIFVPFAIFVKLMLNDLNS